MNDTELHPIADAARRSGLSVSAVRYYSNQGLVTPTGHNSAGHRLYTIEAIARLELVRTLRDLDTDLQQIRRLLGGETTLNDLLTTHLAIVENQERTFRARRAVLNTLIEQGGTTARADLMHRLVTMTDEEREQTIDDFWNEIAYRLDVPEGFVDRLRELRPKLPDEPTLDQLQAWIELGDLVGNPLFREEVRTGLHLDYGLDHAGRKMAAAPVQALMYDVGPPIFKEILELYHAGKDPRSAQVQQVIIRLLEILDEHLGQHTTPQDRDRMAEGYRQLSELIRQDQEEQTPADEDAHHDAMTQYRDLVERINGSQDQDQIDDEPRHLLWMADALSTY
ncbi:MerR family transcriptional regulator [Nocardiopsis sp. JB363]|uniref:helix-turn-helix domain-containing protein n=1 Tax=Nocardiopsis sp. JB363 TaxID=1434837 RepID=UPI000B35987F|nr:MerR family transcriptional regulator [Nocardiopsis sp. JB363]